MPEQVKEMGTIETDQDLKLPGLEPKPIEPIMGATGPTDPAPMIEPRPADDLLEHDEDIPLLKKPAPTGPTAPIEQGPTGTTGEPAPEVTGETGPAEPADDIFAMPDDEKPVEEKPKPDYDFATLATDIGIEFTEGGKEEFTSAVKKAIDSAKTMVEPDLSKFTPEQKILFSWLNDGGSLQEFFTPLKSIDDFLVRPDDEKVLLYLVSEEQLSEEAAKAKLNEIIDDGKFDDYVDKVDQIGVQLREQKFNEIIESVKHAQSERQLQITNQANKEKADLLKIVEQTNEFMGFPIPQNVKDAMKRKIDSGKLTIENDNAQTQVLGHYFMLFGNKIYQKMQTELKDRQDAGYNRGIVKVVEKLHNAPTKPENATGQRTAVPTDDTKKPLDGFKDVDKDTKEGFK